MPALKLDDGTVLTQSLAILVAEGLNTTSRWTRGLASDSAEGYGTATPVVWRAAAYIGAPALVLAAGVMGTLFAVQRRATGGIQAPLLTHVTWSTLMLRYLPPLFQDRTPRRG